MNKLATISGVFRTFSMEVIAGEPSFVTSVREGNCIFELDFSKVYWNSRLQTEHQRLVDKYFAKSDLICDPFAGIGPFSLSAAKNKQSVVFASDLNPHCHKYLLKNIEVNKLQKYVKPFCLDAKEFISESMRILNSADGRSFVYTAQGDLSPTGPSSRRAEFAPDLYTSQRPNVPLMFRHYVLNLPETSFDFLPCFREAFRGFTDLPATPIIHIYCFSKVDSRHRPTLINALAPALNAGLGIQLGEDDIVEIRNVRKVAPCKSMYCISLRLPRSAISS